MASPEYCDVLGVGFGPSNIALAACFDELWTQVDARFVERSDHASWHAGMLLPGTDVQHYAARDLATPRDPRSKYSFVNFLHERGRLYEHTNLGIPFPLRAEYAEYVAWVAGHFGHAVSYGTEVASLDTVSDSGEDWIESVTTDGRAVRARALVLGTGRTPNVPRLFAALDHPRVVHSTRYMGLRDQLRPTDRVAVIGASQSAVEILLDLRRRRNRALAVTRGPGYRLKDTSPFDEEVFHPQFTNYFFGLGSDAKTEIRKLLKHTNYAAADGDVIRELYTSLYEDRLLGQDLVERLHSRVVIAVDRDNDRLCLRLRERFTGEETERIVDAVVLATGLRDLGTGPDQEPHPPLLAGLADRLTTDEKGVLRVARDYRVAFTGTRGPVVYLNGLCESSHGLGDAGSFGQVALRSQLITSGLVRDLTVVKSPEPAVVESRRAGCLAVIESNLTGTGMQALRLAREAGWRILFVTADLRPYVADPVGAKTIAECVDEVIDCPRTVDPDAVTQRLKEHGGPLTGIMTVGEYYIAVAAEVASRFNLPGLDPDAARMARNKHACRETCLAAGVRVPAFGFASTALELGSILSRTGLPCVVKPIDESASVGVYLCRTREEAVARVMEISATACNSRGQTHPRGALVEEFLLGSEVSVETVTFGGRHRVLGVTDKTIGPLPWFVELGHTFPSAHSKPVLEDAVATALAALDSIGFDFGAAHTEIKITAAGACLVEINPRTAGDHIPRLVQLATGVRLLEQYVSMHTGGVPNTLPHADGAAAIRFLTGGDGVLERIDGIEEASRVSGVTEIAVKVRPGDTTHRATNSHQRLGHVIASGRTPAEAAMSAECALNLISLTYAEDRKARP